MAKEVNVYTLNELTEILHVTKRSLYSWIKSDKIHAIKVGKEWRVTEDALNEFLTKGTQE